MKRAKLLAVLASVSLVSAGLIGPVALPTAAQAAVATPTTFSYTGGAQTYAVPAGVSRVKIDASGAQGGRGGANTSQSPSGGAGQTVTGSFNVNPGDQLNVYVGQMGYTGSAQRAAFNGGGYGDGWGVGGGGGASDVRIGGAALSNRVIVGGGGGGGGFNNTGPGNGGGAAGYPTGANGGKVSSISGGGGGTQSAGGQPGAGPVQGEAGSLGQGGKGSCATGNGAGGGGGYYGGAGGSQEACPTAQYQSGGGGGSSYISSTAVSPVYGSARNGDGQVVITPLYPHIQASADSHDFGAVVVPKTSSFALTVTNTQDGPLKISSYVVNGSSAFSVQPGSCTGVIEKNATCTIDITFAPTAATDYTGSLVINSNDPDNPVTTVALTGSGLSQPVFQANPSPLAFGGVIPNTNLTKTVTVTNLGLAPMTISDISLTGSSKLTVVSGSDCLTGPVAPSGGTCTVDVLFAPTSAAAESGSLVFTDNTSAGSDTVAVTGTGAYPVISVNPTSYNFGSQGVGRSVQTTITVNNQGLAPLVVGDPTFSTGTVYSVDKGTCANPVVQYGLCQLTVTFAPTAVGSFPDTLTIPSNAQTTPTVTFTGSAADAASVVASPATIDYGTIITGVWTPAQTVTLTSTGNLPITISTVMVPSWVLSGPPPANPNFQLTNDTCTGTTLQPGDTCTVDVAFNGINNPFGQQLRFYTSAPTSYYDPSAAQADFSFTAVNPSLTVNPTSLSFSLANVGGNPSTPQTVTVRAPGDTTTLAASDVLTMTGAATGDFVISDNTCTPNLVLTTNQTCTFKVAFSPTAPGSRTASISVNSNAMTPPTVSLTGTGQNMGKMTIDQSSYDFGSVAPGSTTTHDFIIGNSGSAAATISFVVFNGAPSPNPYSSSGCAVGTVIQPGSSCTLTVTYTAPATVGTTSNASLQVNAGSTSDPANVTASLTAKTATPSLSVSPSPLAFGNVGRGSASTLTTTITGTGDAPASISAVALGGTNPGDYRIVADGCSGTTVAKDATCDIAVEFRPTADGSRPATLTVTSNATLSPVNLTGTGIAAPSFDPDPPYLTFDPTPVGQTAASRTFKVYNHGTQDLNVTNVSLDSIGQNDFTFTETCTSAAISPSNYCEVTVTFTPAAAGAHSGTLTFTTNAPNGPQTYLLNGTGTAPAVNINPNPLQFSTVPVNGSAQLAATVTNSGDADLTVTGADIGNDAEGSFTIDDNACLAASPIAPGGTCDITITFAPSAAGNKTATLSVTDDAGDSPQSIDLTGTGAQLPIFSANPSSKDYGSVLVSGSPVAQAFTVTNTGTADLVLDSVALTGTGAGQYSLADGTPCETTLAPEASCQVTVSFAPTVAGTATASLDFTDDGSVVHSIPLTGQGIQPELAVSPTSKSFGNQPINTSSADQTFTVTNTGGADLTITAQTLSDTTDFTMTGSCVKTLAPGATCDFKVAFSPASSGAKNATVTFTSDTAITSPTIDLDGTGTVAPQFAVTPDSVAFDNQLTGTSSVAQNLVVTNPGTADLTISGISLTGDTTDFTLGSATDCTSSAIAPSIGSCTVTIAFNPQTAGNKTASVSFTDNATGSPHTVALTGHATQPVLSVNPATVAFGDVPITTSATPIDVTLSNTGDADLTISAVTLSDLTDYTLSGYCTKTLAPSETCVITVGFTPATAGAHPATITFTSDTQQTSPTVDLSGTGTVAPAVSLSPANFDFGSVATDSASSPVDFTITNTGTAPLNITSVTTTDASFVLVNTECTGAINPGDHCVVNVTFTPAATGPASASLSIVDDAADSPQSAALTGEGVQPPDGPQVTTDPATDVATTSATLPGTVNALGKTTAVTIRYATSEQELSSGGGNQVDADPASVEGNDPTQVTGHAASLAPATTYYFLVSGKNSRGSADGEIQSFTTPAGGPTTPPRTPDVPKITFGKAGMVFSIDPSDGSTSYQYRTRKGAAKHWSSWRSLPSSSRDFKVPTTSAGTWVQLRSRNAVGASQPVTALGRVTVTKASAGRPKTHTLALAKRAAGQTPAPRGDVSPRCKPVAINSITFIGGDRAKIAIPRRAATCGDYALYDPNGKRVGATKTLKAGTRTITTRALRLNSVYQLRFTAAGKVTTAFLYVPH